MEQELTFHPSRDDSDKLKVFLSRVCQEYEGWKRRRMDALVPSCARKRARSREPVTMVRSPIITEASVTAACASSTNTSQAPLKRHTKKSNKSPRTCKDTTAARKSSSESFVLQNALYETIWIAFFVAFFFTFVNKFNVFDKK